MNLSFAPFLPLSWLAALAVLAALLAGWTLLARLRGGLLRAMSFAALILALANPIISLEEREPVASVVAVVVDRSASQAVAGRQERTDRALKALTDRMKLYPDLETRVIEAASDPDSDAPSTQLFSALANGTRDIPVSRLAGAVMITDGQVHDTPEPPASLAIEAPVHALITGDEDEIDRRIEIVRAPRFGIVGEEQELVFRVELDGPGNRGTVAVSVRINGVETEILGAVPGQENALHFSLPRGGSNIVELAMGDMPGEITAANNRAVVLLEGIRENLRVLLVSGEPHAGERAWRNLLKSDASVDLVHFTILRPPEKQDGTPISELSLIAFPTRELFVDKINEFDLIILDRYQNRGVLPVLYYDYIARYVEDGGALLVAAGPELAGADSIAATPLAPALPAFPTGGATDAGFYPRLSEDGRRHPVTRGLPGSASEPPAWGRWFRTVNAASVAGDEVMQGADGAPLLVLNRHGEGRVAMLQSDHGWLWARGFEGGGPYVALFRRIAHWLMKEPSLEEEALNARASGRNLVIERQTMGEEPPPATLRLPSGEIRSIVLEPAEAGMFRASVSLDEPGLVEVSDGSLVALAHAGAVEAPEFQATVSTTGRLQPIASASGGLVARINSEASNLPQILPVRSVPSNPGGRMVLRKSGESVLLGVKSTPLFAGLLGLALLLLAFSATWYREGRQTAQP